MWETAQKPPLVDEDWHAICQAIYKGVEGPECENMYCTFVELQRAVNRKKPGVNKKARALWSMRDAKENGEAHNDQSSERQIENRTAVWQAVEEAGMSSPTAHRERTKRTAEARTLNLPLPSISLFTRSPALAGKGDWHLQPSAHIVLQVVAMGLCQPPSFHFQL